MLEEDVGEGNLITYAHKQVVCGTSDDALCTPTNTNKASVPDVHPQEELKRPTRPERTELGRSFQHAVSAHEWAFAESLIPLFDHQRLNDGLCVVLDSVWFLATQYEVSSATALMEKLIESGADDFSRATLRTSFLASCVSACRSRAMSLADTVTVMAQRLRERLKECSGDELMKAEAAAKVQKFTEWALKCIGSHSRRQSKGEDVGCVTRSSMVESRTQLTAFKRFLSLAGHGLAVKDYAEAFDAACFPLTLFSGAIDPGWASGISASAMQGLLTLLVEGGADNMNQCFLEAARFGSTELVRILMQVYPLNVRNPPLPQTLHEAEDEKEKVFADTLTV